MFEKQNKYKEEIEQKEYDDKKNIRDFFNIKKEIKKEKKPIIRKQEVKQHID
jgi:hypothetical protein